MKNKILGYSLLRFILLAAGIFLIYHLAFYFLPKHIQEDEFSFVGELDLIVDLILIFSIAYSAFIYWEYRKFRKNRQFELGKTALIILVISLLIVICSFFLSFKL